jgi:hypothetical protein
MSSEQPDQLQPQQSQPEHNLPREETNMQTNTNSISEPNATVYQQISTSANFLEEFPSVEEQRAELEEAAEKEAREAASAALFRRLFGNGSQQQHED